MSRLVRLIAYCSACDKVPPGAPLAGFVYVLCLTCDLLAPVYAVPVKDEP